MENGPFEDVFPIEHGDIPLLLVYQRVRSFFLRLRRALSEQKTLSAGIGTTLTFNFTTILWDQYNFYLVKL